MRRSLFALLPFAFYLTACANSYPGVDIQVAITNPFPGDAIQVGAPPVTLNAVVANDPDKKGVVWALTVANTGCSPACGTLVATGSPSFSAVYTPPSTTPLNQSATITATSAADHRKLYAFNFTIIPTISVSIADKFSSVVAPGPGIRIDAMVKYDSAGAGVNWTLAAGGTPCAPACGTLAFSNPPSFTALYTPPVTVPAGANASPTITATSVTNATSSDSFTFTIVSAASLLKGNYAFRLNGYDSASGTPMVMAGTITADGNGSITGGEIDFDNGGGINFVPSPATGTYSIDNTFNGITHGSVEISSFHFPGSAIDLRYRFTLSADGKRGRIIEFDGSGYLNSGTIQLQDSSTISVKPSGNFAFNLNSDAPFAGRIVSAGQFVVGSSGITGGIIDQSKAADPSPTYSGAPISAGSFSAPDANGRGTFTLTVNGDSTNYAFYIVDSKHLLLIQIAAGLKFGTVQSGVAIAQTALTADSINTTSVLQVTGMDEPTGTSTVGPMVLIGVLNITGGNSFFLTFDSNDIGTILTSHPANGAITSFDPSTGRAVFSSPGGFSSGFVESGVAYLYDKGSGFFIDTDISTPNGTPAAQAITNNALSGTFVPQSGAPFSVSNLSGNLIAGFGGSASANIPNFDLAVNLDNTSGNYTAAGDLTSLPSQNGAATNFQFGGTFGLVNTALGHGTLTLPAAVFGDFTSGTTVTAAFYMIAPNQFVLIGVKPGQYSGVGFFNPQ